MNDKSENVLALFDFDGTITTKDTLFEFIKFAVGTPKFYLGLAVMSPVLAAFVFKLIRNDVAKQRLIGFYFKGWRKQKLDALGEQYVAEKVDAIIRPQALEKLRWHKAQQHRLIMVSASMASWLEPFCRREGMELLSTKMAVENGVLTGKFDGNNCHGQEKVNRIKSLLSLDDYSEIYAYGDSSGDTQMLAIASKPFYKPFR